MRHQVHALQLFYRESRVLLLGRRLLLVRGQEAERHVQARRLHCVGQCAPEPEEDHIRVPTAQVGRSAESQSSGQSLEPLAPAATQKGDRVGSPRSPRLRAHRRHQHQLGPQANGHGDDDQRISDAVRSDQDEWRWQEIISGALHDLLCQQVSQLFAERGE